METQPRLKTIEMVREATKEYSREYSLSQRWKQLPKKTMYQTYKIIIEHLLKRNEIILDGNKKIIYISKEIILKPINRGEVIYNLSHYGYELISLKKIKKSKIMPLEELIIEILIRYPEARFIEAIPLLLIKNKINPYELYKKAFNYSLINKIGFLLNISFILAKKQKKDIDYLKDLLNQFRIGKEGKTQYFSNLKNKKFLEEATPEIMKKWNLRGRFSIKDFYKEAYL